MMRRIIRQKAIEAMLVRVLLESGVGSMTVNSLARKLGLSRTTTLKHLETSVRFIVFASKYKSSGAWAVKLSSNYLDKPVTCPIDGIVINNDQLTLIYTYYIGKHSYYKRSIPMLEGIVL